MDGSSSDIRNIGVLAHIDAGKTSVTERILHVAGVRSVPGSVDEGTTLTDYLGVERRHGITIKTAAVRFSYRNCRFHLLDTPGHVDFTAEVERVLQVLDGAVIVLCAVSGVQVRTGVIAKACRDHSLPRIYFVNKMDRRGADFHHALQQIKEELHEPAVALQIPIHTGQTWQGIADIVRGVWIPNGMENESNRMLPLDGAPLEEQDRLAITQATETMLDTLSMHDDEILSDLVQGRFPDPFAITHALRRAVVSGRLVPVFCGSSFSDPSIAALMDGIIDYFPDPVARGCPEGIDPSNRTIRRFAPMPDAPLSAYIFKTVLHEEMGLLGWARIWSGTLRESMRVQVHPGRSNATVRRLFGVQGAEVEQIGNATAGEIVALQLAGQGQAGSTLCESSMPIQYEAYMVPEPVVYLVVEPSTPSELPALRDALRTLAAEDASLSVTEEKETGRIRIAGQGELHLNVVMERLSHEFGIRVRAGNPQVPKVETISRSAELSENFVHELGGERLEVGLGLAVEPVQQNAPPACVLAEGVRPGTVYQKALERGIETACSIGPLEGWPLEGIRLTITEFLAPSSCDRRSEAAVELSAHALTQKVVRKAGPRVLVPIVKAMVEVPDAWFGKALASLQARGARIESVQDEGNGKTIIAFAPMESLFGYATTLRSITEGRGMYQAVFEKYAGPGEY